MNDAEFLAEAKKGNLDIGPVAGEDLEKIANRFFKVDLATVIRTEKRLPVHCLLPSRSKSSSRGGF